MIFIGNGSHLKRAIEFTISKAYKIDYVFSQTSEVEKLCDHYHIPYKISDINTETELIKARCSDNIIFSVNNGQIVKEELLALPDLRFYNIHNGLIPGYRGLPEICIIFAILNNESEYGVSLHQIDKGIDTGKCIDTLKFSLSSKDNFQSIMLKSIEYCNQLFYSNFDSIVNSTLKEEMMPGKKESRLYTYKDLNNLHLYKNHPRIKDAVYFGVFKLWFPKACKIIESQLAEC